MDLLVEDVLYLALNADFMRSEYVWLHVKMSGLSAVMSVQISRIALFSSLANVFHESRWRPTEFHSSKFLQGRTVCA